MIHQLNIYCSSKWWIFCHSIIQLIKVTINNKCNIIVITSFLEFQKWSGNYLQNLQALIDKGKSLAKFFPSISQLSEYTKDIIFEAIIGDESCRCKVVLEHFKFLLHLFPVTTVTKYLSQFLSWQWPNYPLAHVRIPHLQDFSWKIHQK